METFEIVLIVLSILFLLISLIWYFREKIYKIIRLIHQQYEYLKSLYFRLDFLIITNLDSYMILLKDALIEKDRLIGKTLSNKIVEMKLHEDYTNLPLVDYVKRFETINSGILIADITPEEFLLGLMEEEMILGLEAPEKTEKEESRKDEEKSDEVLKLDAPDENAETPQIIPLITPKDFRLIREGLRMMKEILKKYDALQKERIKQLKDLANLRKEIIESLSKNIYEVAYIVGYLTTFDDNVLTWFTRGYNEGQASIGITEIVDKDKMAEIIMRVRAKFESIPEEKKKIMRAIAEEIIYEVMSEDAE